MINFNQFDSYEEDVANDNPMMDDGDFENPKSPADITENEDMPTSVRILSIIS